MEEVPLAQLFLLWTENALSEGNEFDGPSYEEIDSMDDMVDAVKALRRPGG